MSKNLTRKGLAFGAIVALGTSLFAGAPAFATGESTSITTSYSGTGTTVLEGADFQLTPTLNSEFTYYNSAQTGDARFSNQYYAKVDVDGSDSTDYQWVAVGGYYDATPVSHDGDGPCTDCYGDLDGIVTTGTANQVSGFGSYEYIADQLGWAITSTVSDFTIRYEYDGEDGDSEYMSADEQLDTDYDNGDYDQSGDAWFFEVDNISSNVPVKFQPYVDLNGDGDIDAGEPTGAATTVTWANYAASNVTVSLDALTDVYNNHDVTSRVSFASGYNATQIEDDIDIRVFQGSSMEGYASRSVVDNVIVGTYNDYIEPAIYSAIVRLFPWAADDYQIGATATTSVATPDVKKTGVDINLQATSTVNTYGNIKAGTKSFEVSATVNDTNGNTVKTAGQKVKFTISEQTLDASTTITAGGKTLKHSGSAISVETTTDANGVAKLTIASDTGKLSDRIQVAADTLISGSSSVYTVNWDTYNYTWTATDAVYTMAEAHESYWVYDNSSYDSLVASKPGSSYTLSYTIVDEWGTVPTGRYQVEVTDYDGNWTSYPDVYKAVEFVNGKADVTITEVSAANRWYALNADLQVWNASTNLNPGYWSYAGENLDARIETRDDITAAGISATLWDDHNDGLGTEADPLELAADTFYTWNNRLTDNSQAYIDDVYPEDDAAQIEGYVTDKNGVPLAGVAVTAKGAGLQFISEIGDDYDAQFLNEVTVYTDFSGRYRVAVASHKSGLNVVTLTSGSVTHTQNIYVRYPTSVDADSKVEVVSPAGIAAGSATPVTVKVTDKYGNGVTGQAVALALTGKGYLSTYSVTTDKGLATLTLITGPEDGGKATISATATAGSVVKSASATTTTGAVATLKASSVKGRLNVVVDNSRNKTVRVYVDGKLKKTVVASSAKYTIKINGLSKGKHKVTVTSDYRNLVTKKSVTIK